MKKLLLFSMLLITSITFAQDTFVRNYKSLLVTRDFKKEPEREISLAVIFNADKENTIVFRYANGTSKKFFQVSNVTNGKTEGGYEYQMIDIIDAENGNELILQLFDNDNVLRLVIDDGYSLEFYK